MLKDNLIMLRNIRGLSQEEIAEAVGISRQAYAKWEKGETIPDIDKCAKLADYYGTTLDALVQTDENKVDGIPLAPAPKGKHIWGTVIVNDRGQIVIPKGARDLFQIHGGDRLIVLGDENEGIALVKAEVFERRIRDSLALGSKLQTE
ncbi:MAG: helix-turn-helix domain-containing protein [Roseburia sp.]|nr:helix-turn-helix domain-containing protein [Ruminococcus sp.]MCM1154301.1 helix-turn-helix domain-containing protein [Roseburia sp.]MCM1241851.1 helix-turn-helix domain-containing protein [Roseburia sp.]